jgi:polyferredoxin
VIEILGRLEEWAERATANIKLVDQALTGMQGSYLELLTILALGLLAIVPVAAPEKRRQLFRHLNQLVGFFIFVFVVFTCMGVFGMLRNLVRGVREIGHENILALYFVSMPVTIFAASMIFGPSFCGWICPTGAVQEFVSALCGKRHLANRKCGYAFSWGALARVTGTALVFVLGVTYLARTRVLFVEDSNLYWSEVLIAILFLAVWRMREWDHSLRKLRVVSLVVIAASALAGWNITSPVHFTFAKVYDPASLLATVVVVLASVSVPHAWCRYLCPWREAIRWAAKHSVRKLQTDREKCVRCGRCTDACRLEAVHEGDIDADECHLCLRCVDTCPKSAIRVVDRWRAEP